MIELWLQTALHGAWQALLVAIVVLVMLRAGSRWPSALREGLLTVALLKFLAPPLISVPTGLLDIVSRWMPLALAPAELPGAAVAARATSDSPALLFVVALLAIHLTGALIVLVSALAGWRRALRSCRCACTAPPEMSARVQRLAARMGIRRVPRVLISDAISAPTAVGVVRPVILVPASLERTLTDSDLDAILAHELAHHGRYHLAIGWLRVIVCALWWWHPAAWVVARSLRATQEETCDDAVLRAGVIEPASYCEVLLRAADSSRPSLALSAGFADRLHPLGRRLKRLLDGAAAPGASRAPLTIIATVVVALVLLPGVRIRSSAPASTPDVVINPEAAASNPEDAGIVSPTPPAGAQTRTSSPPAPPRDPRPLGREVPREISARVYKAMVDGGMPPDMAHRLATQPRQQFHEVRNWWRSVTRGIGRAFGSKFMLPRRFAQSLERVQRFSQSPIIVGTSATTRLSGRSGYSLTSPVFAFTSR